MKTTKITNLRFNPYLKVNNYFMYTEILDNIKKLYNNVKSDNKTSILSIVAYNNIKNLLKNIGFKFTNIQFNYAVLKKINRIFNLNSYKRCVPISKKKLNKTETKKLCTIQIIILENQALKKQM